MNRLRVLALLALAFLGACDRAVVGPSPDLGTPEMHAEWLVVTPANDGARYEQRLKFSADGTYAQEILWYGFYGHPSSEVTGYMRAAGRFRLDGDSLEVRLERSEHWQKYAVGPNPESVVVSNPVWEPLGTVRVQGDRLFHTFESAPADAPIISTMTYQRVR